MRDSIFALALSKAGGGGGCGQVECRRMCDSEVLDRS